MLKDNSLNPLLEILAEDTVLRDVVESFPDAVYIGDAMGIPICNKKGLELLGYKSETDLQMHFSHLANQIQTCHPDTGERLSMHEEPYALALIQGKSVIKKVLIKNLKTGKDVIVRCAASPIKRNGVIVGAIAINTYLSQEIDLA
jgi:PAS domain-containing protein